MTKLNTMVLTETTFINGSLGFPGDIVEVPEGTEVGPNLARAGEQNTALVDMPIADITVRSPGATAPQGVPAGGQQRGDGSFIVPSPPEQDAAAQVATASDTGAPRNAKPVSAKG